MAISTKAQVKFLIWLPSHLTGLRFSKMGIRWGLFHKEARIGIHFVSHSAKSRPSVETGKTSLLDDRSLKLCYIKSPFYLDSSNGFLTIKIKFKLLTTFKNPTWPALACNPNVISHYFLLAHFQLHWPSAYSLITPESPLPHGLCNSCSYCLQHFHPCFYVADSFWPFTSV